jgi:Zn-finger nucleic acid-binding protein
LPDERADGVKVCPRCGGVLAGLVASQRIVSLLDRTLLAIGFEARLGKAAPEKVETALVACPECLVDMQRVRIESAVCEIDACPAHGTWFDPGELEAVMRAYARAREHGVRYQHGAPPPTAADRLPPPEIPEGALVDPGDTGRSPWKKAWDELLASLARSKGSGF